MEVQINIKSKIILLIDGLEPLNVKACSQVSRALSTWLDEQDFIPEAYTLEVSTAGADAVLKNPLQFFKHIGREIKVDTDEGDTLQGILSKIDQDALILQITKKEKGKKKESSELEIPLPKVRSISVVISFKEK